MRALVVAAHPDDEVLGCGGVMARLTRDGNEVVVLILGEGATSRAAEPGAANRHEVEVLRRQALEAGRIVGASDVRFGGLPDNRFDTVALLDVVKVIEDTLATTNPGVVITHHGGDLNVDHEITHRAVLTATRPTSAGGVGEVYSFEVPSATDWAFGRRPIFQPNVFVEITSTLQSKLDAIAAYTQEVRAFPHPRSLRAIEASAHRWGAIAGFEAAEALQLVRSLRPAGLSRGVFLGPGVP